MNPALAHFVAELKPEQQGSALRSQIRDLAEHVGQSELSVLDALAQVVAERFLTRELSHADAMARAAQLCDCAFPEVHPERVLYKVYLALDEAEYALETDRSSAETPESRCRIRVGEVLASCPGNDA